MFLVGPVVGLQFPQEAALPFSAAWGAGRGARGGRARPAHRPFHQTLPLFPQDRPAGAQPSGFRRGSCSLSSLQRLSPYPFPLSPPRGLFTRTLPSSPRSVLSLLPRLPISLGSQRAVAFSMLRDRCMRKRKKTAVIGGLRTSWAERWVRVTEKQVLQLVDRLVRPPGGGDFSPHCHNALPVL